MLKKDVLNYAYNKGIGNMFFEPKCVKIKELLNDKIFNIPDYQRPYQWGDEQLDKLWDDIYSVFEDDENNEYFLGSIVMAKSKNDESKLQIIDGQQRLTTLIIMCNVIYKKFEKVLINTDDDDITKEEIEKFIFSRASSGHLRIRYEGQENYMTDYRNVMSQDKWKKYSKNQLKADMNEPKMNYENTAAFFEERFNGLKNDCYKFIKYIFTKVNVISINCDSENSAIKLFQVINDRGLDLTNGDLIKARIYSELDETQKKNFQSNYNILITTIKKYNITLDDYLTALVYCYTEKKPIEDLTTTFDKEIANKITDKAFLIDIFKNYSDDLIEAFESDNKYVNSIRNLMSITWKIYGYALIMCVWMNYKNNNNELNDLLKSIRNFLYLSYMADYTISTIQQTCFNFIKYVNNKKHNDAENELINKIKDKDIIKRANDLSLSRLSYGDKELKPLMLSIEYEAGHSYIPISGNLEADHILPEEWEKAKNNEWSHIKNEKEIANKIINTLGNITMLEYDKNNKQKNRGFKIKKHFYMGEDEKGKRNDKVTTFYYSIDVAKNNENWNCEKIKERDKELKNIISKMLGIK